MLERLESSLAAIKNCLLNDEKIRKLVYNDSNNALNLTAPTIDQANKYITLRPIYQFENMQDFSQNCMINIYFTDGDSLDEEVGISGIIQISIVANIDKWELVDGKIRPISLADRVIQLVNNKKFTMSNSLSLESINQLIISKQLVGYALLFNIIDGSGDLDKF